MHLCSRTILSPWNSWTWDFVRVLRRPLETTGILGIWVTGTPLPEKVSRSFWSSFPVRRLGVDFNWSDGYDRSAIWTDGRFEVPSLLGLYGSRGKSEAGVVNDLDVGGIAVGLNADSQHHGASELSSESRAGVLGRGAVNASCVADTVSALLDRVTFEPATVAQLSSRENPVPRLRLSSERSFACTSFLLHGFPCALHSPEIRAHKEVFGIDGRLPSIRRMLPMALHKVTLSESLVASSNRGKDLAVCSVDSHCWTASRE